MQRQAPPGAFPPGTKFTVGSHNVTIKSYISEGGFAHVYVVNISPPTLEGDVACLKRVVVPDKVHLNLLRAEVDAMKRLKGHPNIVRYIDSHAARLGSQDQGQQIYEVFLLMEYCSGNGLIDFMNTRLREQLTESEILKITCDVTYGLACMHYLQPPLIHRDLKIENILISSDGTYKLCDFGSVSPVLRPPRNPAEFHILEEDIQRHTTAQYRSPEMIDIYRGFPIDEKSDIWALGVFLYKLCYYTTPFEREGQLAILHASFIFPPKPVYSDRLKGVISGLLREDPRARPNVYQVLKEICAMRGLEVPIKDIYSQRAQAQLAAAAAAASPAPIPVTSNGVGVDDNIDFQTAFAGPAPVIPSVVRSVPDKQQPAASIPEVKPMFRGRISAIKHNNQSMPSLDKYADGNDDFKFASRADRTGPAIINDDPFELLDKSFTSDRAKTQPVSPMISASTFNDDIINFDDDDVAARFPSVEDLAKELERTPFDFGRTPPLPPPRASREHTPKSLPQNVESVTQYQYQQQQQSQQSYRPPVQQSSLKPLQTKQSNSNNIINKVAAAVAAADSNTMSRSPPKIVRNGPSPQIGTNKGSPVLSTSSGSSYEFDAAITAPAANSQKPKLDDNNKYPVVRPRPTATSNRPRPVSMYSRSNSDTYFADGDPSSLQPSQGVSSSKYSSTKEKAVDPHEPSESVHDGSTGRKRSLLDSMPVEDRDQLKVILTGLSQRSNTVVLDKTGNHIDSNVDFLKVLDNDHSNYNNSNHNISDGSGSRSHSHHRKPSQSQYLNPSGTGGGDGNGSWKGLGRSGSAASRHSKKPSFSSSIKGKISDAFKIFDGGSGGGGQYRSTSDSSSAGLGLPPPPRAMSVGSNPGQRRLSSRLSFSTEALGDLSWKQTHGEYDDNNSNESNDRSLNRHRSTSNFPRSSSIIQNRVQQLLRSDSPPLKKTASGYGKYTDNDSVSSVDGSLDSSHSNMPPPPTPPPHVTSRSKNVAQELEKEVQREIQRSSMDSTRDRNVASSASSFTSSRRSNELRRSGEMIRPSESSRVSGYTSSDRVKSHKNNNDKLADNRNKNADNRHHHHHRISKLLPAMRVSSPSNDVATKSHHSRQLSIISSESSNSSSGGKRPPVRPQKPAHLQSPRRDPAKNGESNENGTDAADDWEITFNKKYPSLG